MIENICLPYLRMHEFITYDSFVMVRDTEISTFFGKLFIFDFTNPLSALLNNPHCLHQNFLQIKNCPLVLNFVEISIFFSKILKRKNYLTC